MKPYVYLLLFVLSGTNCFGQVRNFSESKEIQKNNYTYVCEVRKKLFVTLYNKEKTCIGVTQKNTVTNQLMNEKVKMPLLSDDDITYKKCNTICSEVLRDYLVNESNSHDIPLFVTMYINSQTGGLQDISFGFPYICFYNSLPIDVYRKLELELKEKMRFTPTPEGRKANYIYRRVIYFHK